MYFLLLRMSAAYSLLMALSVFSRMSLEFVASSYWLPKLSYRSLGGTSSLFLRLPSTRKCVSCKAHRQAWSAEVTSHLDILKAMPGFQPEDSPKCPPLPPGCFHSALCLPNKPGTASDQLVEPSKKCWQNLKVGMGIAPCGVQVVFVSLCIWEREGGERGFVYVFICSHSLSSRRDTNHFPWTSGPLWSSPFLWWSF